MNLKTAGLWAAAVAVAASVTVGLTHPAVARDREHGHHVGPKPSRAFQTAQIPPIVPADKPKFTPDRPSQSARRWAELSNDCHIVRRDND